MFLILIILFHRGGKNLTSKRLEGPTDFSVLVNLISVNIFHIQSNYTRVRNMMIMITTTTQNHQTPIFHFFHSILFSLSFHVSTLQGDLSVEGFGFEPQLFFLLLWLWLLNFSSRFAHHFLAYRHVFLSKPIHDHH